MENFIAENFFSIIATVAAFGITYILKTISNGLSELKTDYKKLLETKDAQKIETQKQLAEIRELIAGQYVRKDEFKVLMRAELMEIRNENK